MCGSIDGRASTEFHPDAVPADVEVKRAIASVLAATSTEERGAAVGGAPRVVGDRIDEFDALAAA